MLGEFALTASGDGYTAKGLIGDAALDRDGAGFSGRTGEVEQPCSTTPETPKAFASIEEFTDLTAIALTEDGDPILAGGWSLTEDPTPAGIAVWAMSSARTMAVHGVSGAGLRMTVQPAASAGMIFARLI